MAKLCGMLSFFLNEVHQSTVDHVFALIKYFDRTDKTAGQYGFPGNWDDTIDMFAPPSSYVLGTNPRVKQPIHRCPTKPIVGGI